MIRNGNFGSDYNFKLIGALLGLLLVLYHVIRFKKLDYVWVYLCGFIIWFSAEWFLQLTGIRNVQQATLFGIPANSFVQALLRGGFEGGLIGLLGVFFADGFVAPSKGEKGVFALIFIGFLSWIAYWSLGQAVDVKAVGTDVLSRRDMLNPIGIIFLLSATSYTLWWYFKKAAHKDRKRILAMYLVMVSIAFIWNVAEFTANTRWIEAGTFAEPHRAKPVVEFLALAWDTCIDIAMAYVPFLIIPYHLKLIKPSGEA